MLRFLLLVSVCLSALFTLVGAALSREWGWNEYASDELYIVYTEWDETPLYKYFLLNINDSREEWKLIMNDSEMTSLNCSPDGELLTVLLDKRELYVLNRNGVLYNQTLNSYYEIAGVTNSGEVYLYKRYGFIRSGNPLIVNAADTHRLTPPDQEDYDRMRISSSGAALWEVAFESVNVVTPESRTSLFLPNALVQDWTASEEIFLFLIGSGLSNGGQYLADTRSQMVIQLPESNPIWVLSPDATKNAFHTYDEATQSSHIFIADVFSNENKRQLNFRNTTPYDSPLCFLNFRPEMLISEIE